jgi:hypothetical protein
MIAETTITLELAGARRTLYFNGNTMSAFEEETGKFFLDTLMNLFDAVTASDAPTSGDGRKPSTLDIVRKVSMKELRALLWAAMHEYDAQGDPHWPMTVAQVGRAMTPAAIPDIFTAFLRGQSRNLPTKEEQGEAQPGKANGAASPEASMSAVADGGALGGVSLEGAFDFPDKTQVG